MTTDQSAGAPDIITRRLAADEHLIWWDRPIPRLAAGRETNFGLLFGLFFVLFACFWMTMASRAPGPFFLFGIPFVLFGLWMVSAPLRAYSNAGSTLYALTDRRALTLTASKVTARPLDHIDFVETEARPDGSGHVLFTNEPASFMPWQGNMQQAMRKSGFIAVADAERVGREMLDLIDKRHAPGKLPGIGAA